MNLTLLAEHDLSARGECPRLWFEERSFTNRELHEASLRLAGVLGALGVTTNDHVLLALSNGPELAISFFAIWRVGAVAVPVLALLDADELAHVLRSSDAAVVVTTLALLPKLELAQRKAREPRVVLVVTEGRGEPPAPALSFERALAHSAPYEGAIERAPDDIAVILHTGGTSGRSKGVRLSHRNVALAAEGMHAPLSSRSDGPRLLALPLAHALGLSALIADQIFGGRSVLLRRFGAHDALRAIERHRVTFMAGVPAMFLALLRAEEPYETSSMRAWLVSGGTVPDDATIAFARRFRGLLLSSYGLTEAGSIVCTQREGEPRKLGSSGRPRDGLELKIVGAAGETLPAHGWGEICVRGEHVARGYHGMPTLTAATFFDGWLFTGDIGYLDADGELMVVDRKEDLIVPGSIRAGIPVAPKEVEEVLAHHPAVAECAVVGIPDPLLGEQLCACVVTRAHHRVTPEELIAHCDARVAHAKTPRWVELLPQLPRTALGKVKKSELRAKVLKKLAGQS